jgi:hypothetical protein
VRANFLFSSFSFFLSWMENKVKLTLKYIFFVCHNTKTIERAKIYLYALIFYSYVNLFTFNFIFSSIFCVCFT